MKKFFQNFKECKTWRSKVLAAYVWLVFVGYALAYIDISGLEAKRRMYIISVIEVSLIAAIFISPKLLRWGSSYSIKPDLFTQKNKFFLSVWLIIFGIFFAMYIIFYPGGLSADNSSQLSQALTGKYNDHFPVLHTLFAFTLPLKLTHGWGGIINLSQIILFSFALAYAIFTLREYGNYSYCKFFLYYILLNPATLNMAIVPLKDTSFAIFAMLLAAFIVRIHFTNGIWLTAPVHSAVFIIAMVLCTIFRHNAILFTLPIFVTASLYITKKRAFIMFVCFISLVYLIRYPVYNALKVERPLDNRQIEMLGMPMTIIGNAVKEVPDKLDADVLDFAHQIAPQVIWEDFYEKYRGFNSIKFAEYRIGEQKEITRGVINIGVIEKTGWKRVLYFMLKCFKNAPLESLCGMFATTNTVHGLFGQTLQFDIPEIESNDLGLKHQFLLPIKPLSKIVKKFFPVKYIAGMMKDDEVTIQGIIAIAFYAVMVLFNYLFQYVGLINLIVLVFILAKLKFNRRQDWKRLCFALSLLCYNFGTMLLLTGPNFRFFYYSYLVFPLILLVLANSNCEVGNHAY